MRRVEICLFIKNFEYLNKCTQEKNLKYDQNNENGNGIITNNKALNEDYNTNPEKDQNNETEFFNQTNLFDPCLYDDSISFGIYSDDYFETHDNSYLENIYW